MIRTTLGVVLLLLLGGVRATESGPSGAAAVAPGPARLVHDFFPGEFDGDKTLPQLTRLGGVLFFVASDRDTGTNVWRTDGTVASTRRVPFAAAAGTVTGSGMVGILNGRMLLVASVAGDPEAAALFAAGEQGEATFLTTVHPSRDSGYYLAQPPIAGGRFYFQDCGDVRCEVWSTDGTAAGTAPVAALSRPPAEVHQDLVGTFADRWLLVASGASLLAYEVGTHRVLTLLADWGNANAYPVGDSLFLLRADGLYVSSLAAPRASLLFKGPGIASAGWHGGTFFFVPPSGHLWSTDGRSVNRYTGGYFESFSVAADRLGAIGGTTFLPMPGYYGASLLGVDEASHQVTELHRVCSGKYPCLGARLSAVTVAGDQAFVAIDKGLWHSDGTPRGTRPLRTLNHPDEASFTAVDGRLVLGALGTQGGRRLWSTDGTAAGTVALSDGSGDRPFTVQGPAEPLGEALITAAEIKPSGPQLWRIANGRTTPLTALRHLATGIAPYAAFPFGGGRLVLGGNLDWTGVTPEGITGNLRPEIDFCSADASPCLDVPVAVGGRLVFQDAETARLESTDGTLAGRRHLPLEDADGVGSIVASLGTFRDRAMVLGNWGGLWTTDGTPAGTRFVTRLPPEPVTGSSGLPVVAPFADGAASWLFRRVPDPDDDTLSALELWRTDGTAAGTVRMTSIPFDQEAAPYPAPSLVGGKLFFRVLGVLWVSDGTAAGTRALPAQPPGGTFALAAGATVLYAGAGYQSTAVPTPPQTLWAIDPATLAATAVASFLRVGDGSPGTPLGNLVEDTLFFRVANPHGVLRWWRTEGTAESTQRLPDFLARNAQQDFVTAGGRRYFDACDAAHGCELWSTDRLGEDTRLVEDLFPGTRSSDPAILAVAGHTLWFAGTEPNVGRELWTLDVRTGAPAPSWVRPAAPSAKRAREPLWKRMRR